MSYIYTTLGPNVLCEAGFTASRSQSVYVRSVFYSFLCFHCSKLGGRQTNGTVNYTYIQWSELALHPNTSLSQAKSQPSLPQRRWGGSSSIDPRSSSSSVVQRSHSMSAAHGRRVTSKRDPLEQQVQRVARPMSSIPSSRPDSRAASRPSSRPGSRLGTRSSTPLAGGDTQEVRFLLFMVS